MLIVSNEIQLSEAARLRIEVEGSVEVVWVLAAEGVEATCSRNGVLYLVDSQSVRAVDVATGGVLWVTAGDGDGELVGSGGVQVGFDPSGDLRVFAPFEYDAVIEVSSGALRSLTFDVDGDAPLRTQPLPSPTAFRVALDLHDSFGYWPDDTTAWMIHVPEPMFDEGRPFEVEGLTVLPLSSGDLVALRPHGASLDEGPPR